MKALVLFSGGLDSQLVIKILQEQKINVVALHFILPFGAGCCSDKKCVFNFTQVAGVELKFIDCTQGENFRQYLEIIKNPRFGRGAGINPCIDCRIFILKKATQYADQRGSSFAEASEDKSKRGSTRKISYFIATGEVLGERPMSQHLRALKLIEKESGLENKILRPLSAKLLPETEVEKNKLVDREKLYAISGRRRLPQMELAKKYGLKNYPTPAGGCLLCDKEFSKKFTTMLENFGNLDENDVGLLKLGRHFWLARRSLDEGGAETLNSTNINTKINENNLVVVGRNQDENKKLEKLARKNDILIEPESFPGPTSLIRGKIIPEKTIQEAKNLIKKYSKKAKNKRKIKILIIHN